MELRVLESSTGTPEEAPAALVRIPPELGTRRRLQAAFILAAATIGAVLLLGLLTPGYDTGYIILGLMFAAALIPSVVLYRLGRTTWSTYAVMVAVFVVAAIDLFVTDPPMTGDSAMAFPLAIGVIAFLLLPPPIAAAFAGVAWGMQVGLLTVHGGDVISWSILTLVVFTMVAVISKQRADRESELHEMHAAAHKAAHRASRIIEQAPAAMAAISTNGLAEICNGRFFTGWRAAFGNEFDPSRPLEDQLPDNLRGVFRSHLAQARKGRVAELVAAVSDARGDWTLDFTATGEVGAESVLVTARVLPSIENIERSYEARLVQARKSLINIASHELRTPLTPLRMQLDIMLRPGENGPTPVQRKSLEAMRRNATRLANHVDCLIRANQIEQGLVKARPELVDVDRILQELAARQAHAWPDSRPAVDAPGADDLWVHVDARLAVDAMDMVIDHARQLGSDAPKIHVVTEKDRALIHIQADEDHPAWTQMEDEPFHEDAATHEHPVNGIAMYTAGRLFGINRSELSVCTAHPGCVFVGMDLVDHRPLAQMTERSVESIPDADVVSDDAPLERRLFRHGPS